LESGLKLSLEYFRRAVAEKEQPAVETGPK